MNVLMILLLIASILLTMIGASKKSIRIMISGCLSYSMSLLTVVGDILNRLSKGDSAGVMDIYPTMLPDLLGLTREEAEEKLSNVGLTVGNVYYKTNNSKKGKIASQNPTAGSVVVKGNSVDISIDN